MSRKKRFIEKLTAAQKSALKKGYQTGKSHVFRRKCQCILLSHEGRSIQELSNLYEVTEKSVRQWFNDWESQGITGLKLKPGRGRPAKIDLTNAKQVKKIKILIENEPQNLNRVVSQVKNELGIDLSKKTLQRILKNLNTSGNVFAED